jgi:pimeloyl-ACP methyl ester carboxylesterase
MRAQLQSVSTVQPAEHFEGASMGGTHVVLIHSPLVGPGTWMPVARELEQRGRHVVVPSLLGVADAPAPQWRHCPEAVRAATRHLPGSLILVGHSGAGPLLPAMADAVGDRVGALVFVDTFLPPSNGTARLAEPAFMEQLRGLASDGVLPPWSTWFGEEGLRGLVADERLRGALEQEMPRLQLTYFEASIPMPAGWERRPCGYLLFSGDPYGPSAADARDRGWPTLELRGGHHLALVTEPTAVADALSQVEWELLEGG